MMENYLKWIEDIWLLFVGDGRVVVTTLIVMLLFLLWPGNKRLKQFLLYPSLVVLIFINNPISIYYIVDKGLMAYNRYVRLYWLLPIAFVLAFLCVKLVTKAKNWRRIVVALICSGIIIYTGNYMFTEDSYTEMTNLYKIPDDVIEICDFIEDDVQVTGQKLEEIRIVVPVMYSSYIYQYNGRVKILYGRYSGYSPYSAMAEDLRQLIESPQLDVRAICEGAHASGCDYIVIDANKPRKGKFIKYDYEKLIETEDYIIYKQVIDKKEKKKEQAEE